MITLALALAASLLATPDGALAPPAPVEGGAVALAVGHHHACAVLADGGVVCWGDGVFQQAGQVGARPVGVGDGVVRVAGVDDAVGVAAGLTTTCLVRRDHEVVCMGAGLNLLEGGPSWPSYPVPVGVYPASRWARSLAVGGVRLAIVSAAGEVDMITAPAGVPVPAPGFVGAVEVAVGWENVCARDAAGGVRCLGPNYGGENGSGGDGEDREAVAVLAPREPTPAVLATSYETCRDGCDGVLTGAVDLDMHGGLACAALASGRLACWGGGDEAPLGLGSLGFTRAPLYVGGVRDAAAVAVGRDFICTRSRAGGVACFGSNEAGQLGAPGPGRAEARPVPSVRGVVALDAGDRFACALDGRGAVRCWGRI